mgnify:CR=1 FL=1
MAAVIDEESQLVRESNNPEFWKVMIEVWRCQALKDSLRTAPEKS